MDEIAEIAERYRKCVESDGYIVLRKTYEQGKDSMLHLFDIDNNHVCVKMPLGWFYWKCVEMRGCYPVLKDKAKTKPLFEYDVWGCVCRE